ncbi:hypothetical protein ACFLT9_03255 [Acidobacteriota bacterium]
MDIIINPRVQRKAQQKLFSQAGYTFIDLIIASSILFFLLIAIGQLILHSETLKFRSDIKLKTAQMASSKLEEIRSSLNRNSVTKGTQDNETIHVPWLKTPFSRNWSIVGTGEDICRIEIECFLQSDMKRNIRLALYYSRRLGF